MRVMNYWMLLFLILCSCHNNERMEEIKKSEVVTQNSDVAKALKSKADLLYKNDHYQEAIKYFDTLITIDSTKGEYYFKRAYSNGMLLQRQEAIKDYEKSIRYKYRMPDAYFNSGLNCSYENDSLALYYFEKSLTINPDRFKVLHEIEECKKRLKSKLIRPERGR